VKYKRVTKRTPQ